MEQVGDYVQKKVQGAYRTAKKVFGKHHYCIWVHVYEVNYVGFSFKEM